MVAAGAVAFQTVPAVGTCPAPPSGCPATATPDMSAMPIRTRSIELEPKPGWPHHRDSRAGLRCTSNLANMGSAPEQPGQAHPSARLRSHAKHPTLGHHRYTRK